MSVLRQSRYGLLDDLKNVIIFYDENISFLYRRVFNTITLKDFMGVLKTLKDTENAKFLLTYGF